MRVVRPTGLRTRTEPPTWSQSSPLNHKVGYVYASQLEGPQPTTPSQAITEERREERQGPRTLTVYESDGKTPIGQFVTGQ